MCRVKIHAPFRLLGDDGRTAGRETTSEEEWVRTPNRPPLGEPMVPGEWCLAGLVRAAVST